MIEAVEYLMAGVSFFFIVGGRITIAEILMGFQYWTLSIPNIIFDVLISCAEKCGGSYLLKADSGETSWKSVLLAQVLMKTFEFRKKQPFSILFAY